MVAIISDPEALESRILLSYKNSSDHELEKRLAEGISSLEWLLNQSDEQLVWLYNPTGNIDDNARKLIRLIHKKATADGSVKQVALKCLRSLTKMAKS